MASPERDRRRSTSSRSGGRGGQRQRSEGKRQQASSENRRAKKPQREPPEAKAAKRTPRSPRQPKATRTTRATRTDRTTRTTRAEAERPTPAGWGSVARRGARVLGETDRGPGPATQAWREAVARARGEPLPEEWEPERWIEEPATPDTRGPGQPKPTARAQPRPVRLPEDITAELATAIPPRRVPRLERAMADAVRAYQRDRYQDARRLLRPLVEAAPHVAAVRELYGLTLYRMDRWRAAIQELEGFHTLTGSYDQHPVLADCYRALRRWKRVEELWDELRQASPSAEVVAEGRIVVAGARADQGDIASAITLLERAPTKAKRPKLHHLRLWYALADLYERAGDLPRARQLFRAIAAHDPGFVDIGDRIRALA